MHSGSTLARSLTICALVVLNGCAASGVQVSEAQLSSLKVGKTTAADVLSILGQPTMRTKQSDGTSMMVYSYFEYKARPATFIPFIGPFVGGADARSNTVTLRFDQDGKLMDTSSSESVVGSGSGVAAGKVSSADTNQPRQEPAK